MNKNKKEPVKVLYFVDRMLRGGIQSLVIDWVSRFDKTKIHVDFLLLDDGVSYDLEDTLKKMGCNVYKLENVWVRKPIDFIKLSKSLNNFFKNHSNYDVVHMNSTSKNYMVLKYAKKYGIKTRIAHAHALDFQTNSNFKKIVGNILKPLLRRYATDYFACSELAGRWLFGNKVVESKNFYVINNGIDLDRFKYDKKLRSILRKKIHIENDEIVLGHVGRFTPVKNHNFLIELLYELNNEYPSKYKLLLVGSGELENDIKEKVVKLGLENQVIFAGFQNKVEDFFQIMDVFLLPSKYEGLGMVLIEAQASGLPCIATSNSIPTSVKVNNNFEFCELDLSKWKKIVTDLTLDRYCSHDLLIEKKYDTKSVTLFLLDYYNKRRSQNE